MADHSSVSSRYLLDMGGGAIAAPGELCPDGWCGACDASSWSQERWRGERTERRRTGAAVLGRRDSTSGVLLPPPFNCRRGQRGYNTHTGKLY